MKLALAFSTKDRVELTEQTFPVLRDGQHGLFWFDGSKDEAALAYWNKYKGICTGGASGVRGGADAAIVFALTCMLEEAEYTHVGLLENDVLLDSDWLEPTLALFEKGAADGLSVGAVSARSYVDRVLIPRDGYSVMHNVGAGHIIFTRKAAEIILRNYRTGYTTENWKTFALLSGIDIRQSWCFSGQEHAITADWHWDTILAHHGYATLALTPSKATMIGQDIKEQGLDLVVNAPPAAPLYENAFEIFCARTAMIRQGKLRLNAFDRFQVQRGSTIYYPHQLPMIGGQYDSNWGFKWAQGFGPFAYQAGEAGASLFVPAYGSCTFLASGGPNGCNIELVDRLSGFRAAPQLAAHGDGEIQIVEIAVPGTNAYRQITLGMSGGGMFYGMASSERQPEFITRAFRYEDLPKVME